MLLPCAMPALMNYCFIKCYDTNIPFPVFQANTRHHFQEHQGALAQTLEDKSQHCKDLQQTVDSLSMQHEKIMLEKDKVCAIINDLLVSFIMYPFILTYYYFLTIKQLTFEVEYNWS